MASMKRKVTEDDEDKGAAKRAKKLCSENGNDLEIPSRPKKASLLGMPAELRNQILEEVTTLDENVDGDDYMVLEGSHQQPGILRTSRQLRSEGQPMFLERYFFAIVIHDLKLKPHPGQWFFQIQKCQPCMYFQGARSRSNLKAWLRMYFEDQDVPRIPEPHEPEFGFEGTVSQAFTIVETLARCGTTWEAVEKVIDAYMEGVEFATYHVDVWTWDT